MYFILVEVALKMLILFDIVEFPGSLIYEG